MLLRDIMAEFERSSAPLCLEELGSKLAVEPSALEGMLQTLVRKGRLREVSSGQNNACVQCPARGGCVIMERLGKSYYVAAAASVSKVDFSWPGSPLG